LLEFFPDDVDFGVVGDGFQGDVRDPFVDEALADVAVSWGFGRHFVSDFRFFPLAFAAVGEQVDRESSSIVVCQGSRSW
jgi:hypothetical protein